MKSCKFLFSLGYILLAQLLSLTAMEKDQQLYPAATISAAMKKDAYAVCREYRHDFELIDYGKAIEKVHLVVTILDEKGDRFGIMMLPYDKSQKVKFISGKIYNEAGFPEEKLKNAAIQDVNYTSGGTLYDDLRLKLADFKIKTYPYTVEYNYEVEYNGLIGYPNWQPIDVYHISYEKSSFHVTYPEMFPLRIREIYMPEGSSTERNENGKHIREWKLDSISAWREEPMSPELFTQTSRVILAPTSFTYDGSDGKMNSWQELGKWVTGLNYGRDQLPPLRQTEIKILREKSKTQYLP